MSEQLTLPRSGRPPLKFRGELVADADGHLVRNMARTLRGRVSGYTVEARERSGEWVGVETWTPAAPETL